jgi:hypothetical protein
MVGMLLFHRPAKLEPKQEVVMWSFAAIALCALMPVPAFSGEISFPKTGEAQFDTYGIFGVVGQLEIATSSSTIEQSSGITRNVDGRGPFHDLAVNCIMHGVSIGDDWSGSGSCEIVDKDGDSMFTTFNSDTFSIRSGTGKYKGVQGGGTLEPTVLHKTPRDDSAYVVRHKVSWTTKD